MAGSEFRISVSSWRIVAESSTTRTRIFLFISHPSRSKQFHRSGFDVGRGPLEIPLAFEHHTIDRGSKPLHAHLAGRRTVVHLACEAVAEVLGADEEPFGLQIVAYELSVARTH